jgi:hypothetical protein
MKRVLATVMLALCVGWAQNKSIPNTLTTEEQTEGFQLLFDGKSMEKWEVPSAQEVWAIADGAIRSNSRAASAGATMLRTKEDFDNFVLKAEFRAPADIHAHIFLRQPRRRPRPAGEGGAGEATKTGQAEPPGYELQIRDKDPVPLKDGSFLTGSIVNVQRAPADAKVIPDQWNALEVTMNRDHMVVIYNGRKVVDAHDSRRSSGAISLHLAEPDKAPGSEIEFRNLRIKHLP